MSRRNFILLTIVLAILIIGVLVFWSMRGTNNQENGGIGGFISNINPFGSSISSNGNQSNNTTTGETENPIITSDEIVRTKLMKISSMPIAGFGFFQMNTNTENSILGVRYVSKKEGYIYQTPLNEIIERRFSKTIIPKIHEAFFGKNTEFVVMRYLKQNDRTINTFIGAVPKELEGGDTADGYEIKGSFLPDNITNISINPDKTKMLYTLNSGDKVTGVVNNFIDNKKTQLFESPFTEWLLQWPDKETITLTTKPSGFVGGHIYVVEEGGSVPTRVTGDISGLLSLTSPDGNKILYSDSAPLLYVLDRKTQETTTLSIRTLADKCTWSKDSENVYCASPKEIPDGIYPDYWYQGLISFSDRIWKINTATGETFVLADPTSFNNGEELDAVRLELDELEENLLFINQKDSYLWGLLLK